jgi:predicted transposase YbfD/YdcC
MIRVTRYREEIRKTPTETISYYVTNGTAKNFSPRDCATNIREHWFIENKLHYVKDVTFREDFSVKRKNPFIFSGCIDQGLLVLK